MSGSDASSCWRKELRRTSSFQEIVKQFGNNLS